MLLNKLPEELVLLQRHGCLVVLILKGLLHDGHVCCTPPRSRPLRWACLSCSTMIDWLSMRRRRGRHSLLGSDSTFNDRCCLYVGCTVSCFRCNVSWQQVFDCTSLSGAAELGWLACGMCVHTYASSASYVTYELRYGAARSPCESHELVNNLDDCHVNVLNARAGISSTRNLRKYHMCAPGTQDCAGAGASRTAAGSVRAGRQCPLRTPACPAAGVRP
jgi:hypothetical protein